MEQDRLSTDEHRQNQVVFHRAFSTKTIVIPTDPWNKTYIDDFCARQCSKAGMVIVSMLIFQTTAYLACLNSFNGLRICADEENEVEQRGETY